MAKTTLCRWKNVATLSHLHPMLNSGEVVGGSVCHGAGAIPSPGESVGHLDCWQLALARACMLSLIRFFATPWTVAHLVAPLSTGFSRQEYWNGLPFPTPGDLPAPGTEPVSFCLLQWQADSLPWCYLAVLSSSRNWRKK